MGHRPRPASVTSQTPQHVRSTAWGLPLTTPSSFPLPARPCPALRETLQPPPWNHFHFLTSSSSCLLPGGHHRLLSASPRLPCPLTTASPFLLRTCHDLPPDLSGAMPAHCLAYVPSHIGSSRPEFSKPGHRAGLFPLPRTPPGQVLPLLQVVPSLTFSRAPKPFSLTLPSVSFSVAPITPWHMRGLTDQPYFWFITCLPHGNASSTARNHFPLDH